MNAARFISFWIGFCSLSLEIAWVRLYGYANLSTPQAFAYVLSVYLLGIAGGAQVGKRICQMKEYRTIERMSVVVLALSAPIAAVSPWAYLYAQRVAMDGLVAPALIFLTAAVLSVQFPITHHLGTPQALGQASDKKGEHFSRVYILNVSGAALGPLVTGYVLLDYLTITQIFPLLAAMIALVAIVAWWMHGSKRSCDWVILGAAIASMTNTFWLAQIAWAMPNSLVKSFAATSGNEVVSTLENRHGIIGIAKEPRNKIRPIDDYSVYGGNVYDGKTNVDLERNTNGLERPLALHVLQPNAKRVLVLGLSIGSWLTVVEGFPGVEHIDVVEINPGYLSLAQNYGPQQRALKDPRVKVYVDDARRWLKYQPAQHYDLILMNTTWHWRANSSMLLSKEMMQLVNRHLSESGVVAFNATGSVDAFFTASTVFKEVRRYQNFVYGANWNPFAVAAKPEAWEVLKKVSVDGKPGFPTGSVKIEKYARIPFVELPLDLKRLGRPPEVITDDNMLVEYKYGRRGQ